MFLSRGACAPVAVLVAGISTCLTASASATAGAAQLETYEDERLAAVLAAEGLAPFTPTAADRIAFVRIVRHDVFTEDDPWPDWFNMAHVMTQEDVVARELLFAVDEPFQTAKLEESARNLRDMFIFSLVRIVPVRRADGDGAGGGSVGVLVFTRDLWSLRFEQGFQVTGLSIDRLRLQLTERNVAGRAKVASVRFGLDPSSWSLGEVYVDRRVWGGPLTALESIDVLFARATGAVDGVVGQGFVGMPLQSFDQPWGFDVTGIVDARVIRQLQEGRILLWDDPKTLAVEAVPRVWSQRNVDVELSARRQFRHFFVHRLSAGVGFSDDWSEPSAETRLPADLAQDFADEVLPLQRRTLFPFLAYHGFTPKHRVYEDLDTVGQSEAVRLGPSVAVVVGAGAKSLLSSSDTVFVIGDAGVAWDPWHGLVECGFEASARYEDGAVVNRVLAARLRLASAPALWGRVLARADAAFRTNDVNRQLVSLGGDNGLRGYPSQAFFDFGASLAQGTLEWRSLPLAWQSVHVGFAAFYDTGSVFDASAPGDAVFHHSLGIGVRVLFPQFNRTVYRIDLAAPLDEQGLRVLLSLGDTQAVEHARPAFDRLAPRR